MAINLVRNWRNASQCCTANKLQLFANRNRNFNLRNFNIYPMFPKSMPSRYRFLIPFLYSLLPFGAALFWLKVMTIVTSFAHLPDPTLPIVVAYVAAISPAIGVLVAGYRWWADFVRGDYYLALMTSRDW